VWVRGGLLKIPFRKGFLRDADAGRHTWPCLHSCATDFRELAREASCEASLKAIRSVIAEDQRVGVAGQDRAELYKRSPFPRQCSTLGMGKG